MKHLLILLSLLCMAIPFKAQSNWELRVMPQLAFGGKNTVQRPNNNEGTRIYLNKEFDRKSDVTFSPRIELEYTYKKNHFIATASWLEDRFEGISPKEILYDNYVFGKGVNLDTKYKFNTYRIGYRYGLVETNHFSFQLGATLLIRDAAITLSDPGQKAKYTNVGVAPLLSYYLGWQPGSHFTLFSSGDGFAVKAGRAFDIFAGIKYRFNSFLSAYGGYRLLEGGSDGKKVYTMANFNFVSLGIGIDF